jgi:PKD repeat protein
MKVVIRAAACTFAVVGLLAGLAASAYGDVGYRGATTTGISGSAPTGAKPESKLWWNDGSWWAVMWDTASGSNQIFKLDQGTQTWAATGVRVDGRSSVRSDALWDGSKLYVASHWFSNTASSGRPAYLYRYSYNPAADTYSLDSGFPVTINNYKTETLVIDKDSSGKLWATWTQDNQVYVNRTTTDDRTWGQPFALPAAGAGGLFPDDISSVVAVGDRIGVMWSNQTDRAMYWAEHIDGAPDTSWEPTRVALRGDAENLADDHINLKVDDSGRVFAATKTSEDSPAGPLVFLLARDQVTGDWSSHIYGRKSDRHTRPVLVVDETNDMIHMYATSGEAGGTVYQKSTSTAAISFGPGKGKPFIQDGGSPDMNDPTTTKQPVSVASGLVVLASNDTTDYYWHNNDTLVLDADFSASRTASLAPLNVLLQDTSSGYPTSWQWDFGDGTSSTEPNPTHTYDASGTYTVTLTVRDKSGEVSTETRTNLITVYPSVSFEPVADAYVNSSYPERNYATYPTLRVRYGGEKTTTRAYLKFDVTGVTEPVVAAKLRLYVNNPSTVGGTVHTSSNSWTETDLRWPTAPAIDGTTLASIGAAPLDSWMEIDLPASTFANGDGTYTLAIQSTSADDAWYSSKEGTNPPQLVLGFAD